MKDAIRYKITVTATVARTELTNGHNWVQLRTDEAKMGYAPQVPVEVQKDLQVFEQTVDELDMQALVSVVNKLRMPEPAPTPPYDTVEYSKLCPGCGTTILSSTPLPKGTVCSVECPGMQPGRAS